MHDAANTYARVAKTGQTPRETEATVLLQAAARLQAVHDGWDEKAPDLGEALTYNRKVWTVLSTAVTAEDNPLPAHVKQGIANLAVFIFKRTFDVMADPAPAKLRTLISIDREIAAGLRGTASAVPAGRAA